MEDLIRNGAVSQTGSWRTLPSHHGPPIPLNTGDKLRRSEVDRASSASSLFDGHAAYEAFAFSSAEQPLEPSLRSRGSRAPGSELNNVAHMLRAMCTTFTKASPWPPAPRGSTVTTARK